MSTLFEAAAELQAFLESRDWRFCFIGGLAVLRWGEPRFTRDVDLTLWCPFGSEDLVSGPLLNSGYVGRVPDAREFARRSRVLLLQSRSGVPIDVALGTLPFETGMIERSSLFEFETNCVLRICSPEDLVILKLFASGRAMYWMRKPLSSGGEACWTGGTSRRISIPSPR